MDENAQIPTTDNNYLPQNSNNRFNINKKLISLLFFTLIVLAVPITIVGLKQQQNIKQNASESFSKNTNSQAKGYIVVLKEQDKNRLSKTTVANFTTNQNALKRDRDSVKTLIANILKKDYIVNSKTSDITVGNLDPDRELRVFQEYSNVFNGLALDINDSEANLIKQLPNVKGVYKSIEIKENLFRSVPQIHADDIWKIKDTSGKQIKGQGIKIAVIDSGIDYTHPSLGASTIKERPFVDISNINYAKNIKKDGGTALGDESFDIDGNNIAYISNFDQITIYNTNTKTKKFVNLHTPGLTKPLLGKIRMKGKFIVYYAYDKSAGALYLYNSATQTSKKIASLTIKNDNYAPVETFLFTGKKIIFAQQTPSQTTNIKTYDLNTEKEKLLNNIKTPAYKLFLTGGQNSLIAYSVQFERSDFCAVDKNIVQNIDTGEIKNNQINYLGKILDFKNNYVLMKSSCEDNLANNYGYNLLNLLNNQLTKINYLPISTEEINDYSVEEESFTPSIAYNYGNPKITTNAVIFSNQKTGKAYAYDINKKIYSRMSIFLRADFFEENNNLFCFSKAGANTNHIYCDTYSPTKNYTLPTIYNAKVIGGYNFINNDYEPYDDRGHGTHVAGIIGGNGNLKGVAPGVQMIAYKVLDSSGRGSDIDLIKAIDRSIATRFDSNPNNDIDILNISLGAYCSERYDENCGPNDLSSQAVDRAFEAGIISVVSAGNAGDTPLAIGSPGTARSAITVGAVDKLNKIAEFSSRGPVTIGNEEITKPDILAPGVQICSSLAKNSSMFAICSPNYQGNTLASGTSMSAPHIAGAVALLKQLYPNLNTSQLKSKLFNDLTRDLNYPKNTQGYGVIDFSLLQQ